MSCSLATCRSRHVVLLWSVAVLWQPAGVASERWHAGIAVSDGGVPGGLTDADYQSAEAARVDDHPTAGREHVFSTLWTDSDNSHSPHEPSPYFHLAENGSNITAQLHATAHLDCRVKRLKDKTVSWVKKIGNEIRLLTFGLTTYSNDNRYVLDFQNPDNWKLEIQFAQHRDAGQYECHVSTHPPMVLRAHLHIVAPVVEIIDDRGTNVGEKFYKTGSTIELRCTISQMPQAQTFIMWKHGLNLLNYDTSRGGISVKTDMSSSVIVSTLYIANATARDSGNYTCSLGDVATGSVAVHILNGEHPAAMQRGNDSADRCCATLLMLSAMLFLCSSSSNSYMLLQR